MSVWHELVDAHEFATLVAQLLDVHYDPANRRSISARCNTHDAPLQRVTLTGLDDVTFARDVPDTSLLLAPLVQQIQVVYRYLY